MTLRQLAARDRAMAAEMAAEFLEDVMPVYIHHSRGGSVGGEDDSTGKDSID